MAGYLFHSDQAKTLCDEWKAVLDPHGLPYFHMVDCAHGSGVFKGIPKNVRASIAAKMIGNIKRRTIQGLAVAVNLEQWNATAPDSPIIGSPYSFCATVIMAGVQRWIERTQYNGGVAYFFEAGHESRGEANWIMEQTFNVPEIRNEARHIGHAFVEKSAAPPVQAADLLAWQFYTDVRRQVEGATTHRKDFANLIEHPHQVTWVTPDRIQALKDAKFSSVEGRELLRLYHGDLTRNVRKGKPPPPTPLFSKGGQPS